MILPFNSFFSDNGENCAHTLAMREFEDSTTLQNLIEATKRMLGTSYGVILRHKRIMDGHLEKLSQGAIESAKAYLMDFPSAARDMILSSSKACVEGYDK